MQLENVVSTLVRGGDDQSPAEALKHELERREEELKKLRKELEQARMKSASSSSQSAAAENVREVKGVKVLATRADNLERPQLRTLIDNLRNKLGSGVVVLGSVSDGKVALIVGVTKDLTSRVQAGKIIAEVAKKVGGSGGGRPDMAEAGRQRSRGAGFGAWQIAIAWSKVYYPSAVRTKIHQVRSPCARPPFFWCYCCALPGCRPNLPARPAPPSKAALRAAVTIISTTSPTVMAGATTFPVLPVRSRNMLANRLSSQAHFR